MPLARELCTTEDEALEVRALQRSMKELETKRDVQRGFVESAEAGRQEWEGRVEEHRRQKSISALSRVTVPLGSSPPVYDIHREVQVRCYA